MFKEYWNLSNIFLIILIISVTSSLSFQDNMVDAQTPTNTGSINLDREAYPIPFGIPENFVGILENSTTPDGRSIFPIHQTGIENIDEDGNDNVLDIGEFIDTGDLTVHFRVNDPDFDISSRQDIISTITDEGFGPVKISIIRGSNSVVLGYAGSSSTNLGLIDVGSDNDNPLEVRSFGPMKETDSNSGVFEIDVVIRYTDGPADPRCPDTTAYTSLESEDLIDNYYRFDDVGDVPDQDFCILQGDIIQVEYTDLEDKLGNVNTVSTFAIFGLQDAILRSDAEVYKIGSDMILTLIESDLDLDSYAAETYDLDLIEWDSDAATITMGDADGEGAAFDPEPLDFRETGDNTGIFQIVIEIPEELANDRLERGEEIVLEYTDWGPSGSDYVGQEDKDVNLTLFTSNFGATVELDQKVYTWTDKVYVTVVAPDHDFDTDLVDEIGNTDLDPVKISTRGFDLDNYKLVETGTSTGIFTGEVVLTGFRYDVDGDGIIDTEPLTEGSGPYNGFLQSDNEDGITISFEFSEDETVVGSALIKWNVGTVNWIDVEQPEIGKNGKIQVIDPDMNINPDAVDNFMVKVKSDSDEKGVNITVNEINDAAGIFEGEVIFDTVTDNSSFPNRLKISESDIVQAVYDDYTVRSSSFTKDMQQVIAVLNPMFDFSILSEEIPEKIINANESSSWNIIIQREKGISQKVEIGCDSPQQYVICTIEPNVVMPDPASESKITINVNDKLLSSSTSKQIPISVEVTASTPNREIFKTKSFELIGENPDTESPTIISTPDNIFQTIEHDSSGIRVSYTLPSATGLEDSKPIVTCKPSSGSFFDVGTTPVECVAIDESGNKSDPVEFTITVSQKPEPPQIPFEYIIPPIVVGGGYLGYKYLRPKPPTGKNEPTLRNDDISHKPDENQQQDNSIQSNVDIETRFGFE